MASVGNGVVIADGAFGFRAEHGVQVDSFRDSTERRLWIPGLDPETPGILGDEDVVEIGSSRLGFSNALASELSDEPALERAVDTLAPAAGLRTIGEDEIDGQLLHGDLKVGRCIVPLEAVDTAMAGSGELTGSVEVQDSGQAMLAEDVVEGLEASVEGFLGIEEAVERFPGGIVGGEDEGGFGSVFPKPGVWAAVEEEHLAELSAALSSSAVNGGLVSGWPELGAAEPVANRLIAKLNAVFIGQGFGEVGDVVVVELVAVEGEDSGLQFPGFGVGGRMTGVAMDYAFGTSGTYLCLKTEDLTRTEAEHVGCSGRRQTGESPLDNSQFDHFTLLEQ